MDAAYRGAHREPVYEHINSMYTVHRVHFILSSVKTAFKTQILVNRATIMSAFKNTKSQKPWRGERKSRKRGENNTFYTNTVCFQDKIFISQAFGSPGHVLLSWSDNSGFVDCIACSFILWLPILFFHIFWLVFLRDEKRALCFFIRWQQPEPQSIALQITLNFSKQP